MKRQFREMPEPLNANERFLFAISERLDVLIDLIEKGNVSVLPKTIEEEVEPAPVKIPATRKRSVKVTAKAKEE